MPTVRGRDFLSICDLDPDELRHVLDLAGELKARSRAGDRTAPLRGKVLALVFEKPSLRTHTTLEVGMLQLGGHTVYLGPQDIQMGTPESPPDVARHLERWVDGIAARTFAHSTLEALAEHARIPGDVRRALAEIGRAHV